MNESPSLCSHPPGLPDPATVLSLARHFVMIEFEIEWMINGGIGCIREHYGIIIHETICIISRVSHTFVTTDCHREPYCWHLLYTTSITPKLKIVLLTGTVFMKKGVHQSMTYHPIPCGTRPSLTGARGKPCGTRDGGGFLVLGTSARGIPCGTRPTLTGARGKPCGTREGVGFAVCEASLPC